jgi:hypothetical protein
MGQKILVCLKWTFLLIFLVYLFNYIATTIEPCLIYHVQQPPFYLNFIFFSTFLDYPGGLTEYAGNFLAQSYYNSFWGSMLLVLLVAAIMLLFKYITSRYSNTGKGFFWMFLPAILLVGLFHSYYLPLYVVIKVIFAVVFFTLILIISERVLLIWIALPILSFLLYYLAGSAALTIFFISCFIHFALNMKDSKKFTIPMLSALLGITIPYLSYTFFFNISYKDLWFNFMPEISPILKYDADNKLYYLFFLLPGLILIMSLVTKLWEKPRTEEKEHKVLKYMDMLWCKYLFAALSFVVIIAVFYIINNKSFNKIKKEIVLIDYNSYNKNWQKVIDLSLNLGEYDFFVNYNYNRAIYNIGKFSDMYFYYPQRIGIDALFPDKITASQITIPASDFYYELGYISEALHWAYEAQSSMPNNPRVLRRLVMTSLIEGRYQSAENYLSVLEDGFYNDKFVNKYKGYLKDTSLIGKDAEIIEKRLQMPLDGETPYHISKRLGKLYKKNDKNARALEYLAMTFLLEHKLGDFIVLLPELKKIYPNSLPFTYEIATMLYVLKTKKNFEEYQFSDYAKQQFIGFNKIFQEYNNDKNAAQYSIFNNYGKTYLYYIAYVSPMVTGSSLKSRNTY